jgi:two-component system alkaline phosphatase synthesis response regulator PhoP
VGKKILVVDDDADFVLLLTKKLAQAGHQVLTAFDGFQAVQSAHREPPDLVLLDIRLPAGGGAGVLKNLKSSAKTLNIPIIAMSASDSPDIQRDIAKYGLEGFLKKPFDFGDLLKIVDDLFSGSQRK